MNAVSGTEFFLLICKSTSSESQLSNGIIQAVFPLHDSLTKASM